MPSARTRIKICGVRTPDIARAAVEAGADAIGMVFVPGTPRALTIEEAEAIVRVLPPLVEPIGLFVNAAPTTVVDTARSLGLRTVQLHGREAPAGATAIAPLRVIKALHFDAAGIDRLADWTSEAVPNLAAILWDAPPPPTGLAAAAAAQQTGGHGRAIDWDELAKVMRGSTSTDARQFILAGGLNAENVGRAIEIVRPYAVDVSSGVESSRGVKDVKLVEAFCRAVRATETR